MPMALAYPTAIDRRQALVAITNSMGSSMRLGFGGIYSNVVIASVVAPPYLASAVAANEPPGSAALGLAITTADVIIAILAPAPAAGITLMLLAGLLAVLPVRAIDHARRANRASAPCER